MTPTPVAMRLCRRVRLLSSEAAAQLSSKVAAAASAMQAAEAEAAAAEEAEHGRSGGDARRRRMAMRHAPCRWR